MLEISTSAGFGEDAQIPSVIGFGGDTLNTAIYMSRLGTAVNYVSALGDDRMSDWMIAQWQNEGVDCQFVSRFNGGVPGLYMIEVDEQGERSFNYWRKGSPASQLFANPKNCDSLFSELQQFDHLFLSGISVAILPKESQRRLLSFLVDFRARGGRVIFDLNHRPNLWQSPYEAIEVYQEIYKVTDIALPTYEDEANLFGYSTPSDAMQAILLHGVPEVVLKMGEKGCLYAHRGDLGFVPTTAVDVVDTTSAGDSFNAAYLSARLSNKTVQEACSAGHELASTVIQHKGAVIPASAMPKRNCSTEEADLIAAGH